MPSSTFNSELIESRSRTSARTSSATKGLVTLLAGLALLFLCLEISAPIVLNHLSHMEHTVEIERKAAETLRPFTADGRPTVLFVGNSLLQEGVQMDALHAQLAPQYEVRRFAIVQTHYLDWYFGIRRLLQEGSRPSVIVLALNTDQLASRYTLGEIFAHRQMSTRDFPEVIRDSNLDRTTASTYFFAHWSRWQADKGFIRQCVMILMVPKFRDLAGHIADHGYYVRDLKELTQTAEERLPQLAAVGRQYGVRIILMIPPSLHQDHSAEIQRIGAQAGIPVWILSPPGDFPPSYFRDGFHLNTQGSGVFTARLAEQVRTLQMFQSRCQSCSRRTESGSSTQPATATQIGQGQP